MPLRPARVGRVGVIGAPVAKTAVVAAAVTSPGPCAGREDRRRGRGRHTWSETPNLKRRCPGAKRTRRGSGRRPVPVAICCVACAAHPFRGRARREVPRARSASRRVRADRRRLSCRRGRSAGLGWADRRGHGVSYLRRARAVRVRARHAVRAPRQGGGPERPGEPRQGLRDDRADRVVDRRLDQHVDFRSRSSRSWSRSTRSCGRPGT